MRSAKMFSNFLKWVIVVLIIEDPIQSCFLYEDEVISLKHSYEDEVIALKTQLFHLMYL